MRPLVVSDSSGSGLRPATGNLAGVELMPPRVNGVSFGQGTQSAQRCLSRKIKPTSLFH